MVCARLKFIFYFCLYAYLLDSRGNDGSANTKGKQLPRPAFRDVKMLLSACNLIEI